MRVTVNQPCPFPALHIVQRMMASDVSVHLTQAQFTRRIKDSFATQNAYEILAQGQRRKLIIPVKHSGDQKLMLRDARIDYDQKWQRKHLTTIRQAYCKAPYFEEVFPVVEEIIGVEFASLAELSMATITAMFRYMRVDVRQIRDDLLPVVECDSSRWMLQISRSLGASEYLCGEWAVEHYLRKDEFDRASVAIVAQYWIPPIYPQRGTDLFVADLSILDAMMVMGRGSATYVM